MKWERREAASQRHPQAPTARRSRKGPVRCGRTRGYPLLREGTQLRPLARPKEGLTLAEPIWSRAAGLGAGGLAQQPGSCPSHGVPCICRSQALCVWGR